MLSPIRLFLLLLFAAPISIFAAESRPNIVVVLADDLGYGDLGCYGHPVIKTPHLDTFANRGVRFTDCYAAAPNCSPSRTGLMTGRTPYRAGIHNWIPVDSPMHVRRSETTIATVLQRAGYATCHVGKWHLCGKFNHPDQPQPGDHGFDHWFATQNNALPTHRDPDNFVRNGKEVGPLKGFSSHLVADEAIRWLSELRDKSKPFFLFVCFHEPHEPIASAKEFTDLYPDGDDELAPSPFSPEVSARAAHHGNVSQMDAAFGRLMQSLEELGVNKNTLILFTSDNGPAITRWHPHGSAGPLRDKKGSMYEGGIRVPGMLVWEGRAKAGQISRTPISGVDIFPTLCEAAGIEAPKNLALDGVSILPALKGESMNRRKPLYWQFNVAKGEPKVAMRDGDWKMLASLDGPEIKPFGDIRPEDQQNIKSANLQKFELYNLRKDIAEATDVSEQHPEKFATLKQELSAMYKEVRDESPTWPAWIWPRYEGGRINAYRESLKQQ